MGEELSAANAAWDRWTEANPGLCNTDFLSFLAGWKARMDLTHHDQEGGQ